MDEDIHYHHVVTSAPRRPSQHLTYDPQTGDLQPPPLQMEDSNVVEEGPEVLPKYWCSVYCEGVFTKKMEIENTTKRAEDRRWHSVYAVLQGTALNIYEIKKDWGLGRGKGGPTISPDNPPWVRRGKLERSYSLQYADVGIALDYQKRRHVIRVRAEADQFLLSCVELSTFLKWLESLFAAIDVAAPLDERDFPETRAFPRRRCCRSSFLGLPEDEVDEEVGEEADELNDGDAFDIDQGKLLLKRAEDSRHDHRLSITSYPNEAIDDLSGKWAPAHYWGPQHDMRYAKLCYSVLLFRSPRKSNYIVSKGKKWFVDWMTGRMVRVLPPEYGEIDLYDAWHIVHAGNQRL
ncbi:unnamed protein product [Parascedosporium putredinis]|uniref:PH domain-containing protein n=1 Tax=Parascedosporium putredinis TaxID=1442378 RepID=A0A9P1MEP0_9PEZI|nr:unnamed protein product [Parascedosporium putredinis]CAI8003176.1 unnamed protein product [Parascedosporium putredinis]